MSTEEVGEGEGKRERVREREREEEVESLYRTKRGSIRAWKPKVKNQAEKKNEGQNGKKNHHFFFKRIFFFSKLFDDRRLTLKLS